MTIRRNLRDIVAYIESYEDTLNYNGRVLRMWEGQVLPEIEKSLKSEVSDKTFDQLRDRIPPINILRRVVSKLSRVYAQTPDRQISEESRDALRALESSLCIDETMSLVDSILNLHKFCGIEPFIDRDGNPQIRVIPGDRCLAWTSDLTDPLNPEVFIKFVGKEVKDPHREGTIEDIDGNLIADEDLDDSTEVVILYSRDEIAVVDIHGNIRGDLSRKYLNSSQPIIRNPFGRIPICYLNTSKFRLVPVSDTDLLNMTILIPKLLADLNHAVQYQSHSVFIALDLEMPEETRLAPNTVITGTSTDETKTGKFEVLSPQVDVEKVLQLIQATLILWLESRHIKAGSIGKSSEQRASGVAKIIDEADATQFRTLQTTIFNKIENKLWFFLKDWIDYERGRGNLLDVKPLSDKMELSVIFGDQMPIESSEDRLNRVKIMKDMGVVTPKQAVRQLLPTLSDSLIDKWIDELEKHKSSVLGDALGVDFENSESRAEEDNQQPSEEADSGPISEDNQGEDPGR